MGKNTNPNKNASLYSLFAITLIVAASSILYELLLGQTLSAFFGNTIREYSITIGLYMFSMGLGAFLIEGKFSQNALQTLLWVEIALSFIGGTTILIAHILHIAIVSTFLFSLSLYLLIVIIGILTGMEIPLLFKLASLHEKKLDNTILGIDYVGAFLGSVLFAFFFYPIVGLTATAFVVALGNSIAGLLLYTQIEQSELNLRPHRQFILLGAITLTMALMLAFSTTINELLIMIYIS